MIHFRESNDFIGSIFLTSGVVSSEDSQLSTFVLKFDLDLLCESKTIGAYPRQDTGHFESLLLVLTTINR